ncbi:SpoIIE family protein phosphatase [Bdellovibrio bacteriovorus]|uniref:PP2C family protein-serine/threonine phosphatase n=1 Tax=Bdellovibrio bacteriovorus TaxID=959 RepID=UPI0021CF302C|nr:SpoIIE family protein phosphatase [Bdellovibrio bacteriovorus]UXR63203.1 SpoIIE family protein phosphatase [Bdellovibrio bacteriovorus]
MYLILALRIFEEDKIAYVFDSSSRMSGTMAAQIKTQLNGVLGTTKPIFQDYLSQQKFSSVGESIFQNEFNLEAIVVFKPSATGAYERSAILEKVPDQTAGVLAQLQNHMPSYFAEVEASRRVVKVPRNRPFAGGSLALFADGFGSQSDVTTVEKEKALGAVQILIRKSLIFFGLLISVTVILSLFASSGLTQALTQLFDATKKVAEGDFNIRVDVKSSDEVGSLADNFNIMAAEVSRLLDQTAEKARMESELQTAKTVQETLFPETQAKIGPLAIAGYYEPASECGGDWWHYCQIGNKIFLWIGDATGHGAPAALITSAAKSASTIIERLNITPAKALELLNRSIYDVSKGRIMMTFFLASFDLETGELAYCNASHEAPFLMKKGEGPLKKKDLIPLNEVNNPRLGQARDSVYEQTTIQVETGDLVFFYTDGIPDIQDPAKAAWGEREFIKALIAANKDFPGVSDSVERFAQSFQAHRQGAPLIDDVTFFVVKNEGLS